MNVTYRKFFMRFMEIKKKKYTFIGIGETHGFFSGKKWVYIYKNIKSNRIKILDNKMKSNNVR